MYLAILALYNSIGRYALSRLDQHSRTTQTDYAGDGEVELWKCQSVRITPSANYTSEHEFHTEDHPLPAASCTTRPRLTTQVQVMFQFAARAIQLVQQPTVPVLEIALHLTVTKL